MTQTIEKVTEAISVDEMKKRDGETAMAVGLFIFAVGVPVAIATLYALDSVRGAVVNGVCGAVLLLIGGVTTAYGWHLFHAAHTKHGS